MQKQLSKTPDPSVPHRRQAIWQIYLPLILAVLVTLGLAVFAAVAAGPGNTKTAQWAEISTIWLVMPLLGILILFVAVIGGLIYLQSRAIKGAPGLFRSIHRIVLLIGNKILGLLNAAANPVIKVNQWSASWNAFWGYFKK